MWEFMRKHKIVGVGPWTTRAAKPQSLLLQENRWRAVEDAGPYGYLCFK